MSSSSSPERRRSSRSPDTLKKKLNIDAEVAEQLELRRKMRESNRARTFEKSITTARQLRDRIAENEREAIHSAIEKLGQEIEKQLLEHGQVVVQLEEEFRQRENLFRETIDASFAEMRDRHSEALTTLVLYRNAEELRADRRASSDVRLLERISISLADRQEFDEAIAISKHAETVHANDVEGRKTALRENYEKLRRNLLGQFA
jgi:hypothetical protein